MNKSYRINHMQVNSTNCFFHQLLARPRKPFLAMVFALGMTMCSRAWIFSAWRIWGIKTTTSTTRIKTTTSTTIGKAWKLKKFSMLLLLRHASNSLSVKSPSIKTHHHS
ncbi:hypothetical protein M758_9G033300 [Ceratodon purpureus]|uniref:Uncharacterized protein n=1 Tax=Ceratodon purpureus TaxID=3225 RepID=A0A8T0GS68_CERPU|nr:hypothetical protein KC19_9G030700 [Ceratodon purpureus]KAG0561015.1 hypothetical protein KC19_9G030800 [Ceratodon purpureus]KAG0605116.1 hypothetical protein M758_9G032800 [Ceratodon purpureus]KAG0605121.1 hypothetical protein M758_9G033300 [Ceratodon purpureus]